MDLDGSESPTSQGGVEASEEAELAKRDCSVTEKVGVDGVSDSAVPKESRECE